jgi:hypothetical protein
MAMQETDILPGEDEDIWFYQDSKPVRWLIDFMFVDANAGGQMANLDVMLGGQGAVDSDPAPEGLGFAQVYEAADWEEGDEDEGEDEEQEMFFLMAIGSIMAIWYNPWEPDGYMLSDLLVSAYIKLHWQTYLG